jgi:hypothetical protein
MNSLSTLDNQRQDPTYNHENYLSLDHSSISRASQIELNSMNTGNWPSSPSNDDLSPTMYHYRHSTASSVDSGRSSTALYDSPKVHSSMRTHSLSLSSTISLFL